MSGEAESLAARLRRELQGQELLVATRSAGKLRELVPLLAACGATLVDLADAGVAPDPAEDLVESFATFEENALAKARYFRARSGGRPVLADDSGLSVDALGGAPGVYSRRYAGAAGSAAAVDAANNARLLAALAGVEDRRARFVCALALVGSAGELVVRGETHGRIVTEPSGRAGFGYDPLFRSDALGRTFAEADAEAKAAVGHRGRAVAALLAALGADVER